jgi:hypothetical protein
VHAAAQRRLRRWLHAWAAWQIMHKHKLLRVQLTTRHWQQTVCRSTFSTWWESCSVHHEVWECWHFTGIGLSGSQQGSGIGKPGCASYVRTVCLSPLTADGSRVQHRRLQASAQRQARARTAAAAAALRRQRLRRVLQGWAQRPGAAAAKLHRRRLAVAASARGGGRRRLLLASVDTLPLCHQCQMTVETLPPCHQCQCAY